MLRNILDYLAFVIWSTDVSANLILSVHLAQVWDVSTLDGSGQAQPDRKVPLLKATAAAAAHDKDINALAVSPNDALICSGSQDRTARVSL